MTILVQEAALTQQFSVNLPNLSGSLVFVLTSQYSHQPIYMDTAIIVTNDRYSTLQVTFPTGFGDEHKNGIYNWTLKETGATDFIQKGLAKIITEPGGGMGTVSYDAGFDAEERVADVFYRPNY